MLCKVPGSQEGSKKGITSVKPGLRTQMQSPWLSRRPKRLSPPRWRPGARVKGPRQATRSQSSGARNGVPVEPSCLGKPRCGAPGIPGTGSAVRLERRSASTGDVASQPKLCGPGETGLHGHGPPGTTQPGAIGCPPLEGTQKTSSEGRPVDPGPQTPLASRGRKAGRPSDPEQQRETKPKGGSGRQRLRRRNLQRTRSRIKTLRPRKKTET